MLAPISDAKLDNRIQDFLARKDKRFPEMQLLAHGEDEHQTSTSTDRDDSVWFKGGKIT